MEVGMRCSGPPLPSAPGCRFWQKIGGALLTLGIMAVWGLSSPAWSWGVEVRNLGISRVGERTMITVILNQPASPRVTPLTEGNRSQVVIEFPQAQAARLPETLSGDDTLVKSVRTEASSTGVKITVDMFPDRPYIMSRESLPLSRGLAMFRLGLRPDPKGPVREAPAAAPYQAPPAEQNYGAGPPPSPGPETETRPYPEPPPSPMSSVPPTGEFADLYQLVPQARGLWDFLRGEGFSVNKAQKFDTPGKQLTRSFTLTSSRYPDMRVRVANLPASGSGAPGINVVDLVMDNVGGKASDDYQKLRQWNFAQIRTKYEDIGDFFEDALKPLRIQIRQKCQERAQRYAQFIADYMRQAVPRKPNLGDEAVTLIKKKVSPRFEGVQYTLSENPLVILNLVDYLYIRVYYFGR
jgi:hypothetical protein